MQTNIHLLYGADARYRLSDVLHQIKGGTALLLDVRELDEWTDSHLIHANPLPLSELREGRMPDPEWKNRKIYLYCRSGLRVWPARVILENQGFAKVIPLEEGFPVLEQHGF